MATLMFAIKCPSCGKSAFEDYYCHTDEMLIFCHRCGYIFSKKLKFMEGRETFQEEEYHGYGVVLLTYKDGRTKTISLGNPATQEDIEKYRNEYLDAETDQAESFLALFENGAFQVVFGTPSANFYLTFEDYKNKMFQKYGEPEPEEDFMIPVER